MGTAALIVIGIVVLVVLGIAALILQRSWGASLDRSGVAPSVRYNSAADIADAERAAIRELLDRGNKIAAIKRVRELTGLGLKEAKDYVESWEQGGATPAMAVNERPAPSHDLAEVRALALAGNKIQAIKLYRELTGVGLKEAKDFVDSL